MGAVEHYDFCGYATKNDLLCSDGRTIRRDAFKDCDGKTVPLIWNHRHDDPEMVIGHALLENRPDGVFMYGKLNDTDKGIACKKILENQDLRGLSIWANKLKQKAGDVLHGVIQEVSLVLAGANPGAIIDFSLAHGDGTEDEIYAYLIGDEYTELQHGDIEFEMPDEEEEVMANEEIEEIEETEETEELEHADSDKKPKSIKEIFEGMTEEQKTAVYALMASLEDEDEDEEETEDDDDEENDKGENKTMKHNAFENDNQSNVLSHDDMDQIFRDAKRLGSLREAVHEHMEDGVLAHSISGPDDYGISRGVAPVSGSKYGMYEPSMLFPDYKAISETPDWIKRDTGWVADFMSSVKHTPFSRIKSVHADITAEDARALGYIKGNQKKDEFFTLIKRTTDPQTIYKKQRMDRDDIIDITGFDVIAWIRGEMRIMLEEELARAALIGDGRSNASSDKINENHIRPIAKDADLYAVKVPVAAGNSLAVSFIEAAIRARKDYKGSGNPVLYTTEDMLTEMLLIKDLNQRYIYTSVDALATTLRVRKIVTVPVMEGVEIPITTISGASSTTSNQDLYGIIVNLQDYTIGADKGGAINMFDDFDIDYNQEKYLIETRCSGALTKPYSALVLYEAVAADDDDGE